MDVTPWQADVSALIERVKQSGFSDAAAAQLRAVMRRAVSAGADAFVIACTELSALVRPGWVDVPVVDASDTLARECLARVRPAVAAGA
jgi:aspartate/glutamate racemase